jgi:sterol desaturase/sphingolipid hydroxylase (fatty acid hydroxylase superfamily)
MARQFVSPALALGGFAALLWLESRYRLRGAAVEPKARRVFRNAAIGTLTALLLRYPERVLTQPAAKLVERRRWGLLARLALPRGLETAFALALMDYTLYVWHILLHRVPLLWRMHLVHHVDLELDASTALRFHFTELLASVPYRIAQIALIGVRPAAHRLWRLATLIEVVFHHSNLRLPIALERGLSLFIVTPRLHGIHHSIVEEETASNFSSGLTVWDRLHGTLRANVPQADITIGVPAYRDPHEITLARLIAMPFGKEKEPIWVLPSDTKPQRVARREPEATASRLRRKINRPWSLRRAGSTLLR